LPATIRDVARLAGCSIKTVSRVINGEAYVTEETRAKVQAAIRAAGYAPNISAKRLAENKSYMLCVLIHPEFNQPAAELLTRFMDIGYEENYDILIQPYDPPHAQSKRKLVSLIYEHRVDGFVISPPLDADDFVSDMISTYKVPQVQINPINLDKTIPYVAGSDFQGAYKMTDYLISLGHRQISFLTGPQNMRASSDRLAGFRAALDAAHIPINDSFVRGSQWTFDEGYMLARQLFELSEPPSAIFAGSDEAAFGVIYAAQEMDLHIPEQISVCGYDDVSLSKNIWPGLTTVHQPTEELAEKAIRLLIDLLKGKTPEHQNIVIASHLAIRGSTGKPDCA
jgi:LacI family transcriptional regulator